MSQPTTITICLSLVLYALCVTAMPTSPCVTSSTIPLRPFANLPVTRKCQWKTLTDTPSRRNTFQKIRFYANATFVESITNSSKLIDASCKLTAAYSLLQRDSINDTQMSELDTQMSELGYYLSQLCIQVSQ